jgi:translation initiation factor IF-2
MENFLGKQIKEATFSSPIRIIGWNELPAVGSVLLNDIRHQERSRGFAAFAEKKARSIKSKTAARTNQQNREEDFDCLPIVSKASEVGSLDAT